MAWVVGIGIFFFLLFAFPKQVGGLILILLAIGGAAWIYSNAESKAAAKERSKIVTSARTDLGCADPQFPIGVSISNGAKKQINSVDFTISAKRPGYSSEVYSNFHTSDRILKPGDVYFACWSLSRYETTYGKLKDENIKALNWSARVISVRFSE
ncbi:hypothetical protein [Agrobacterium sp. CFBP2214]|uniref:hypothetical protein n=1 Tax=Agrobacterium sp. CFBP2214 TaxID=3040274 RepID=UPI00254A1B41|nr:hypothetical protein [Agrobacterium sp. CFBP2214]